MRTPSLLPFQRTPVLGALVRGAAVEATALATHTVLLGASVALTRRWVDADPKCLEYATPMIWCLKSPSYAEAFRWTSGGVALATLLPAVPALFIPYDKFAGLEGQTGGTDGLISHGVAMAIGLTSPFHIWPVSTYLCGHGEQSWGMLAAGASFYGALIAVGLIGVTCGWLVHFFAHPQTRGAFMGRDSDDLGAQIERGIDGGSHPGSVADIPRPVVGGRHSPGRCASEPAPPAYEGPPSERIPLLAHKSVPG